MGNRNFMEKRPIINIKPAKTDIVIEIIGYVILIAFWLTTIATFNYLPEQIPIHYNGFGEVDNYGKKVSIFLLPIISSFLFVILSIVSKNPESFNYNVKITEQNAENQYRNSIKMMRIMKIIIVIIFFMIDIETISIAIKKSEGLGVLFLPLTLSIIFIPIIYFAYKSKKMK
jgi:uncharacterized membrane protein